jgi:VanZ family protein
VIARVTLLLWLGVTALLTLWPTSNAPSRVVACIVCGETGGGDFLLNVLLFVPLGAALVLLGARVRSALLLGALLSACIEFAQWTLSSGRTVSAGDLVANGLGAYLGALAIGKGTMLLHANVQQQRVVVASWAAAVAFLLALSAWTTQPFLPDGTWFLQRAPVRNWTEPMTGQLLKAGIDRTDLPSDRIADSVLIARVRLDSGALTITEVMGAPTRKLAYAARLVRGEDGRELAAIGRLGDALVVRTRSNGARLRLADIGLVLPDAYGRARHDTISISLRPSQGTLVSSSGPREWNVSSASPFRGWSWFLPATRDFSRGQLWLLDLAWSVVLVLPMALLAWHWRRH